MYKESTTIEAGKKPEEAGREAQPEQVVESPEDLRNRMMSESAQAVDLFKGGCADDLAQVTARAEKDGLTIDPENSGVLEALGGEADVARTALLAETEERYQQFASEERAKWAERGVNPLTEAGYARQSAEADLEQEQGSVEKYKERVDALRVDIDEKKSSLIGRILNFKEIRRLERELGTAERIKASTEKMAKDKKELLAAYNRILSEQQELGILMEDAYKENKERDEGKRLELLKEEEGRDLSKLTSKYGEFFVHDIVDADWKPSENNKAINTKNLDLLDQLDIVQGLDPTISVSTLKQDTKSRTFGEGAWGVFLSGGRVLGGEPSDAGTKAYGLRDRRFSNGERIKPIESIDNAITSENRASYNELVVENPEIGGVYAKWDKTRPLLIEGEDIILSEKGSTRDRYTSWWETIDSVMQRGLPLFVLNRENNTARMMYDIDVANKSFKVTPEYSPENMVDIPGIYKQHLGDDEKRKAAMRVFDKAVGLIPENEREQYTPDGTEKDGRGFYNIH